MTTDLLPANMAAKITVALYHGGPPRLRRGDLIAPHLATDAALLDGCPTCEARRAGTPVPDDHNDPTRVYVTTDREYASIFAAGYPLGGLYRVEVDESDMVATTDDSAPSWGVPWARVVSVYSPLVRLSPHDVRRFMRRYGISRATAQSVGRAS